MSKPLNSRQPRGRQGAALGLALLVLAAVAPQALSQQIGAAAEDAASSSNALTVVRDPDTHALRAPTAAEHQALQQAAAKSKQLLRAAPQVTQQKFHGNSARGVRLTDEFMSTSIAVRNPDGTLTRQCLEPGHSALGVHSHPQATQPVTE